MVQPLASVVISAYRRGLSIKHTVRSVLNQTHSELKLLLLGTVFLNGSIVT